MIYNRFTVSYFLRDCNHVLVFVVSANCLQCFDAVGWAVGSSFGL